MNDGADTEIIMGLQPHFRTLVIQDLIPSSHNEKLMNLKEDEMQKIAS
jgi:hypothetical protein